MGNWKELWLQNYNNENELKDLPKHVKTVGFGAKKEATYLGWAVVEKFFKLQDGTVEQLVNDKGSKVFVDEVIIRERVDQETGEVTLMTSKSYFIKVKVEWGGRTYIEDYPIQNSSGSPLSSFTQNDLNTSFQRAKTKAIAIVSGIGFWLYEGGNSESDQYDGDEKKETTTTKEKEPIINKKSTKTTPVKKQTKAEKEADDKKVAEELFKEDEKEEVKVIEVDDEISFDVDVQEDVELTDEQRDEYTNTIKSVFLGDAKKSELIKTFLKEVGKSKFQEFTDNELVRIYNQVK